jgi:hypothetical protein
VGDEDDPAVKVSFDAEEGVSMGKRLLNGGVYARADWGVEQPPAAIAPAPSSEEAYEVYTQSQGQEERKRRAVLLSPEVETRTLKTQLLVMQSGMKPATLKAYNAGLTTGNKWPRPRAGVGGVAGHGRNRRAA